MIQAASSLTAKAEDRVDDAAIAAFFRPQLFDVILPGLPSAMVGHEPPAPCVLPLEDSFPRLQPWIPLNLTPQFDDDDDDLDDLDDDDDAEADDLDEDD